jgi:putative ABC transport system permease protein
MLWWRIAWRNLWRNRRRTLITAGALAFGYLGSVLMVGISDGMTAQMIENGTGLVTGQVQVTARGYRPEQNLYATIGGDSGTDVAALLTRIRATPGVVAAAPRVYGAGLLSVKDRTSGVLLLGVDPGAESRVSRVLALMERGRAPRVGEHAVAIGVELARKLGVQPGDELVLVAPAADGSLGNDLYRVSGIYKTGLADLDGAWAIVPLDVLQRLLALAPDRVHEIAAAVQDPWSAPAVAAALDDHIGAAVPDASATPWTTFRPELASYAQLAKAGNGLIIAIVFVMAIFGVANTMLLATYERRREFAVVRALGTTPDGLARTVVFEGLVLGVVALGAGAILTAPILLWWHHAPPDLSGLFGDFTTAGALIHPVLRVEYSTTAPIGAAFALLVTAVVAAVYPAWRAMRVPPADALAGR